ncbi:Ig-like domain-containing protein [Propioniciclava flava]|uniref:Fibronectin type-III domain-containing protein n=1 Tax=Propioniciclava flava TaxID=2072026 RepID=A0A4Q2EH28_9ACTN|nr:Ig-like domain-containing protein [Propioniciclava flava]RXW32721.1 hypothetical protein C1706_06145 [Propioniciclava flava]
MAGLLRKQRRGIAALLAIAVVMALLAALHPGVPARQMQLNDGGIWVTNQNLRLVGHLNYPSRTLDGAVRTTTPTFDVSQAGDTVFVEDAVNARTSSVDTAAFTIDQGAEHGKSVVFSHAANTTAFADAQAGRVWVMDASQASGFSTTAEPTLEDVPGARAIVGTDGVANIVLPSGAVKRVEQREVKDVGTIQGLKDLASGDITMVGDTLVVLDRASSMVRTVHGSTPVDSPQRMVLQQPGPAAETVLVAGEDSYLAAPLTGGDVAPTPVQGKGKPARPVLLQGCSYLAWAGTGNYVRTCGKPADSKAESVEALRGSTELAFRTNRDVIVLNDTASGRLVMVNQNMQVVDNWEQINTQNKETQDDTLSDTETTDQMSVDKNKSDTKPDALDDEYGVRPGKSFTLPVLENDVDPDGDLLLASVKTQPKGATVSRARGGEALSIDVPADAPPSMSFQYTADDGRGGTDDANVRITVFGPQVNKEPFQRRNSEVRVGSRGEASYAILSDFRDPEGDAMYVQGVSGTKDLSVEYRPDGVLTIKDLGTAAPGPQKVQVSVSDGVNVGTGTLTVNILEPNQPPIANADHVTALKGQKVTVQPLANDSDPNGRGLRLTSVDPAPAGMSIAPDFSTGTVQYSSETTGTFYLGYQVANESPTVATGWIRVDVAEPVEGRPVPSDDLAMLPAGGATIVDALANDTDPQGGVLILKSVKVPDQSGLAVEIIDHSQVKMSSPAGLSKPVDVTYTVSNGSGEATGRITVVPLPASATLLPPRATDDEAVVRDGDIVSIPVLRNDFSPSGLALAIDPNVTIEGGDTTFGDAFVSRDKVRFRAKKPGTLRLNYTVRDTAGNFDTGQVVLTVRPLTGAETNSPPVPQPLEGRVLAGATVTIPVPTDGIDPEGDSVSLVGLASGPVLGTATVEGSTIVYTASGSSVGTDTFSYAVADRFGATSTASLRVGVATPNATNQAPFAVPDDVSMRPDRRLSINPVANDVDPDGDSLSLVADSVVPTDSTTTVPASVEKGQITLRSPREAATLRYYYDVTDGRGGTARGVLTVHVSPDAETKPPVAIDDLVSTASIGERTSVEVDVLANDYDPDGSTKDLTVSTKDPGATVTNGTMVTVQLTDQRQVVLYSITDLDGHVGQGAIIVPPLDSGVPYLDLTKIPLRVKAGEMLDVHLRDIVIVRPGHSPRLTFADTVRVGAGADTTQPVRDDVTLQYRSLPEFTGASSITFEVTDGANADDPKGRRAILSAPIIVEPSTSHQPVFTPSEVSAAAGETRTVDLKQMVTDPDEGDMDRLRFTLGAVPAGFTARLDGSSLVVEAAADVAPGTRAPLPVTVTDGSTAPVSGTITLTATASTRPLMTIRAVSINDGKAGQPSVTDLSTAISNPFSDQGKPVTIAGGPESTVPGTRIEVTGLRMSITPPAGYHGQLVVTYTAVDATGSPSRSVKGTVTVTVRDKPDAPTAVTAETHLSRTATVSWTAGANNGAPITDFTVSWRSADGGANGSRSCGAVTTCLITTLSNNASYTFTVTATNEVGESDPSAASAAIRPDVKPNPPGTPIAEFGDKQASLSWAAAEVPDGGSPVRTYTVQVSPGGATQQVSGTSMVWSGLTNGTAYTFRIQAHNDDPNPSDWSASSVPVVPAGVPLQPAAPQAVKDAASPLPPSVTVRWGAPGGNGDDNLTYEMRRTGTESVLYSKSGLSTKVTMSVSESNQSFEVRARNKAGWGNWSPASNGVRGWQTPGAVTGLSSEATGANGQVKITFGAANGNGATASEMKYYWLANGITGTLNPGTTTVTNGAAFPNGRNTSVAVYAVSTVNGESVQGASTSTTVNPYGPPTSPSMSCSASGTSLTCSWSGGNDNGRSTNFQISGDWSTGDGGASGTHGFGDIGYSASRSLCVQAVQAGGATGARNCNSATTQARPKTVEILKYGNAYTFPDCTDRSCQYITIRTQNFDGNVQCTLQWEYPRGVMSDWRTYTIGPNASYQTRDFYGMPGGRVQANCGGVVGGINW